MSPSLKRLCHFRECHGMTSRTLRGYTMCRAHPRQNRPSETFRNYSCKFTEYARLDESVNFARLEKKRERESEEGRDQIHCNLFRNPFG